MAFDWHAELATVKGSQVITYAATPPKSFAQVLGGPSSNCNTDDKLPLPVIKGDALCIALTEDEYAKGLVDCS